MVRVSEKLVSLKSGQASILCQTKSPKDFSRDSLGLVRGFFDSKSFGFSYELVDSMNYSY